MDDVWGYLRRKIKRFGFNTSCGCRVWLGPLDSKGYAKVTDVKPYGGQSYKLVHRLILARRLGRDPKRSEYATHTCDNPECVAPKHIKLGSAKSNNAETRKRGRFISGREKVTWDQRADIRRRFANGESNKTALARDYGITDVRVGVIIRTEETQAARTRQIKLAIFNEARSIGRATKGLRL